MLPLNARWSTKACARTKALKSESNSLRLIPHFGVSSFRLWIGRHSTRTQNSEHSHTCDAKKRGRNGVGDETPSRIRPRAHYKLQLVTAGTAKVTETAMASATVRSAH